jgi:hypothetical protein
MAITRRLVAGCLLATPAAARAGLPDAAGDGDHRLRTRRAGGS